MSGILAVIPNFIARDQLDRLPDWLPKQQVTLGLDPRGGSQLLLEIDGDAVLHDRLSMIADAAEAALRNTGVAANLAKVVAGSVSMELKAGADTGLGQHGAPDVPHGVG